jgi:hypothetical protein
VFNLGLNRIGSSGFFKLGKDKAAKQFRLVQALGLRHLAESCFDVLGVLSSGVLEGGVRGEKWLL